MCERHIPPPDPSAQCHDPADAELVLDTTGAVLFDPLYTCYPRSSDWTPPDHIARYMQIWLRKPLEREVRNCLRAECPHPTILDKISATPEFDNSMVKYMSSSGRNLPRA